MPSLDPYEYFNQSEYPEDYADSDDFDDEWDDFPDYDGLYDYSTLATYSTYPSLRNRLRWLYERWSWRIRRQVVHCKGCGKLLKDCHCIPF